MSDIRMVSRRGFLGDVFAAGALIVGARIAPLAAAETANSATWTPNVFAGMNPDGTVILIAHRSEMGTGIRTSLPMVLADEMEADWARVRVEQALGDEAKYGSQNTDGSASIREFYTAMREMGASVRLMLERAAAARWNVSPAECSAQAHAVTHGSGKKLEFGELAALAAQQ